eukprot:TRINITY_DN70039_c0_g1_i1.p1 TRINITY_DN70039_c0_g1~~TRINITY_DN70039_c0_g1_i1.p1  ORF type:complete len:283 (+),score=79.94 TRINITY_DN70039_c0_g1_i1:84-851(+)
MGMTGGKEASGRTDLDDRSFAFCRGGLGFRPLRSADQEAAAQLLGDAFTADGSEGLAGAAGIPQAVVREYFSLSVPKHAADGSGLSIVAEDLITGNIVGALLAEDLASLAPEGVDGLIAAHPAAAPLSGVLDDAGDLFRTGHGLSPGELPAAGRLCHIACVGVASSRRRRETAFEMVRTALGQAARLGYTSCFAEALGGHTQEIFSKAGMQLTHALDFASWELDGETPLAELPEPWTALAVMEKSFAPPPGATVT